MKYGRRILAGLMLAAGLTIFILGARHSPPPVPEGFVKIQYWEKWSGSEAVAIQQIVDSFNATVGKEKHIYVEMLSMSLVDQKTMVATAGGVPPDVAGLWDTQLNKFAALGALEPLDDLAKAYGIGPETYKPIYWKAITSYHNRLWGLISTPASIALHYNKQVFAEHAADLRAAGLDPDRAPATLQELDKYAEALTTYEPGSTPGDRRIKSSGFLPMEPGWYVGYTSDWFGGAPFDDQTGKLQVNGPSMLRAFEWMASYPKKYGKSSITEFRSGLGTISSTKSPFFTGEVAMVQQGPWEANYVESFAPAMNRWNVPAEKVKREMDFSKITEGMTLANVTTILGEATPLKSSISGQSLQWDAGIKRIVCSFENDRLKTKKMNFIPAEQRKAMTQWGVVPYPSYDDKKDVTLCPFDVLAIPRGSKHKAEAFEFIAYVNRQDVMERLCSMHCKNSPLRKVSADFITYHPNPYIDVFERLANSENAFVVPSIPIWPEVFDEITVASQKCYSLEQSPAEILDISAKRCEEKWEYFQRVQALRAAAANPDDNVQAKP